MLSLSRFICFFTLIALQPTALIAQSLLYKIEGEAIKYDVYLYGTIHAMPQSEFFIDDVVLDKLKKSEQVVFEVDISNPEVLNEVQSAMMMKGTSLDNLLTPQEIASLSQFFSDSLKFPYFFIKHIKPIMLSSFLLPKLVGESVVSYENYFLELAQNQKKSVKGFETVNQQIAYMDSIPLQEQAKVLMESISNYSDTKAMYHELVQVYKSQNIEDIHSFLVSLTLKNPLYQKYLIDERNKNWVSQIIAFGNTGITFIAVGCGHLGGENGLINLLEQLNLSVLPIE